MLVEQLLSVDDFLTFKAMMAKRNLELGLEVRVRGREGQYRFRGPPSRISPGDSKDHPPAQVPEGSLGDARDVGTPEEL